MEPGQRLDSLDPGRGIWSDLGWRAVQVFIASMLVEVSGTDFVGAAKNVKFWEDAVGAAIVAVLTQVLALASSRAGIPPPVTEPATLPPPGEPQQEPT
jgi:hypothetical protein